MRAAAVQLTSTADRERNLATADRLTRAAARAGVTFAVARTWPGSKQVERAMKGRVHGSRTSWRKRCPLCRATGKAD